MRYGSVLKDITRPGRYEGLEAGAVVKPWGDDTLKVALAFPDVYEIGMSHLGLPILYEILNGLPFAAAERAYAPWPDMEALLREKGLPLVTRESGKSLNEFDLVGITLQYELSITNALTLLDLGKIPVKACDRTEGDPIVLGGGPVAANPEPYADFFDAFFIGEAEEAISEIAEKLHQGKTAGLSRAARIASLGGIEGIYLPCEALPVYENGRFAGFSSPDGKPPRKTKRRVVADLSKFPPPRRPPSAFGETVHDRLAVEVARGCTRGCRFCQAGYLYRPVREREPGALLDCISGSLGLMGHEEVGLLSLSTGDYSSIGPLIVNLIERHGPDHVSVSLPSLRIDGLDPRLASEVAKVRKTGFTLAPEAGSERLRKIINKDFGDEAIISTIGRIFDAGWKSVKLYFMAGLPFEEDDDRAAIARLARKIAGVTPGGKNRITVSVSNFVPKPHTPFQWSRQYGTEELNAVHALLRREVPGKKIDLKYHDPKVSRMEGALSRGDRRVGEAILAAWRKGCRMDGWSSEFNAPKWEEAFRETGVDPEEYLRERDVSEPLPWELVDIGVDRDYLLEELKRAARSETTGDCRSGDCTGCGLCDFETLKPVRAEGSLAYPEPSAEEEQESETPEIEGERLRFIYAKRGSASFLSHLETSKILLKAFRAAGVVPVYSRGFNPHPKMQLGPALSLGTESDCETGELSVPETPALAGAVERINGGLPEGLSLVCIWRMNPGSRTLTGGGVEEEYFVTLSSEAEKGLAGMGGFGAVVGKYRSDPGFTVLKRRKNKPDRHLPAKDYVTGMWTSGKGLCLSLVRREDGGTIPPDALVAALIGLPEGVRALDLVVKTRARLL